jgi:hypothetical protein
VVSFELTFSCSLIINWPRLALACSPNGESAFDTSAPCLVAHLVITHWGCECSLDGFVADRIVADSSQNRMGVDFIIF